MTVFIRCLASKNKQAELASAINSYNNNQSTPSVYVSSPSNFKCIPGAPFVYWTEQNVRDVFSKHQKFESGTRTAKQGIATADDFRFLRSWWEIIPNNKKWKSFAKGGGYSPFYADLDLVVNWFNDGAEIKEFRDENGKLRSRPQNLDYCLRRGITWSLRPSKNGSFRAMPDGTVFSIMGSAAFVASDQEDELMSLLAICNSDVFNMLISLLSSRGGEGSGQTKTYDVGCFSNTPIPKISDLIKSKLIKLSKDAYQHQRRLHSSNELDHSFFLPSYLRSTENGFCHADETKAFQSIILEVNRTVSNLYELSECISLSDDQIIPIAENNSEFEIDDDAEAVCDPLSDFLSWCVGVVFGRFDWHLVISERPAASEPKPFDPLPAKSPGMLLDGAEPFHKHSGILVEDQGHPHDLGRLVEEVLTRVNVSVPVDVRRWLHKDFFAFHLQRYSKSRRKAPIYWPLSTASGSYTLWVYYPSLNNQTLFIAVNDFLDGPNGKLTQVKRESADLRMKGSGRSRDEEKQYEALQTFEQELTDLRDALLKIAPAYQPNHDDGVQITAAPLWPLFRHKPWQKVLKDTWTKLEKGDYDWAHLAMAYWPERVRAKCKTDKSLAIAHGLEDLYVEPEAAPEKTRVKKKAGGGE